MYSENRKQGGLAHHRKNVYTTRNRLITNEKSINLLEPIIPSILLLLHEITQNILLLTFKYHLGLYLIRS